MIQMKRHIKNINMDINLTNFDDSLPLSSDKPAPFISTILEEMVTDSIQAKSNLFPNRKDQY